MRIVFAEGLDALTMQRLARDVDCAVGSVYTYFPSKSALVAELQRAAIEVLDDSCARFEARIAAEPGDLALVVGYARFWADTFETFPEEARLMQRLMSDTSRTVADEDVSRVLPAALRLLDRLRRALEGAVEAGALEPGDALRRTVVLAASLNGVLLLDHVARVDPELFDGRRLAVGLVEDLLRGWGADARAIAGATRRVTTLAASGPLAAKGE
jgi:AcrR family transcriptional regulator